MNLNATSVLLIAAGLGPCVAGCSSRVLEPVGAAHQHLTASSTVPGYVHSLTQSAFDIGSGVVLETDQRFIKRWRGSNGAFALDPTNGWTMASLDANAAHGPYILDEVAQASLVKSYFIAAGIPAEQISGVATSYQGSGVGQTGAPPVAPTLDNINSILRRAVAGIPVVESYAWAKMRPSGVVEMESVFWPAIDTSVVSSAVALGQTLSDPTKRAAFLAKLPPVFKIGGVVIHHSDPSIHTQPQAYASFDATVGSDLTAAMHHFDTNGNEFRLPHELTSVPQAPRPVPASSP